MKSVFTLMLLVVALAATAGGNNRAPQLGYAASLSLVPAIEHRPLLAKPVLS
jgi:hypothetical protein